MNVKQCPNCKSIYDLQVAVCTKCGHTFRTLFVPPDQTQIFNAPSFSHQNAYPQPPDGMIYKPKGDHSVPLAIALSFFFLIGGQVYNEQYFKSFIMLVFFVIFALITCGFGAMFVFPVCMYDAYCIATKLKKGEFVGKWEFF